jgi:aerobic-type carbon monoxide dehydrogenase small subunit (CoxS/CutS family)
MKVELTLNGQIVTAEGDPLDRLLDVLRDQFDLIGTKEGCGEGECGACTVLLDGEPVLSCLTPLMQCHDRSVDTVEGIAARPEAKAFLERFVEDGATQCGACTSGIIVTGWKLSQGRSTLRRGDIQKALAGNLCRCTGYEAILRALEKGA